jgi:hypothetical protein
MGKTRRVHVNQHKIRANQKEDKDEPVVTVKTYNSNDYGHAADIECPHCGKPAASVVSMWTEDRKLSCGATVWVETQGGVLVRHNHEPDTRV